MSWPARAELSAHPDRVRWNARWKERREAGVSGAAGPGGWPGLAPHPLAERALSLELPPGPAADLACGVSGSALALAQAGRQVTAVDISDVALGVLAGEAARRRLAGLLTLVQADLGSWRPQAGTYALVLCTGYFDRALFAAAARALVPGGVLGWEALSAQARLARPSLCPDWCLAGGEPASLLPPGWTVLAEGELRGGRLPRRSLLARRIGRA